MPPPDHSSGLTSTPAVIVVATASVCVRPLQTSLTSAHARASWSTGGPTISAVSFEVTEDPDTSHIFVVGGFQNVSENHV